MDDVQGLTIKSSNLNIVECKFCNCTSNRQNNLSSNLNIVECKYVFS